MPLKAKLYLSFLDLAPFCSKASHGQHWVQTTLKLLVQVLAMAPNSWLKIDLPKDLGLNRPPPLNCCSLSILWPRNWRIAIFKKIMSQARDNICSCSFCIFFISTRSVKLTKLDFWTPSPCNLNCLSWKMNFKNRRLLVFCSNLI